MLGVLGNITARQEGCERDLQTEEASFNLPPLLTEGLNDIPHIPASVHFCAALPLGHKTSTFLAYLSSNSLEFQLLKMDLLDISSLFPLEPLEVVQTQCVHKMVCLYPQLGPLKSVSSVIAH